MLGVYGSFALAAFIELHGFVTVTINCQPVSMNEIIVNVKYSEISGYANDLCWNGKRINVTKFGKNNCSDIETGNVNWSGDPDDIDPRRVVDNLPKLIFLFGMFFLLPRFIWDNQVGGILQSYIKHIKFIISLIKNKCEKIPNEGKSV